MLNSKFITFEGGEGSGKSTQCRMLSEELQKRGIPVICTREIGGTNEAEKIRSLIMNSNFDNISELLLIMAARYEHLNKVIIPSLVKGIWVICDRYIDSTAAYQTNNSSLEVKKIYELHEELMNISCDHPDKELFDKYIQTYNSPITKGLPDKTFFLDISPEEGLKRAHNRGGTNKFEDKSFAFHQKVYNNFKLLSKKIDRINSIDCNGEDIYHVHRKILSKLDFNH